MEGALPSFYNNVGLEGLWLGLGVGVGVGAAAGARTANAEVATAEAAVDEIFWPLSAFFETRLAVRLGGAEVSDGPSSVRFILRRMLRGLGVTISPSSSKVSIRTGGGIGMVVLGIGSEVGW